MVRPMTRPQPLLGAPTRIRVPPRRTTVASVTRTLTETGPRDESAGEPRARSWGEDDRPAWAGPARTGAIPLWFHFCAGHHVEFLYWQATLLAGERVISAAENADKDVVEHWLARAAELIHGSGAMLHYCATVDPARYDPCLRPSMAAERDDFSRTLSCSAT